ncbi:MAG: hypothetical protein LBU57_08265 [Dysgonamonadaceae bacterium]|jgi:hypothetical protein|nr:hypothetical protein [Dysgonamonadaceae bacterium]
MKKFVTLLFAGALMISFAACNGGKKEETKEVTPETELQAAPAETVDPEKALKDFESYVERYVEVIKKMKNGDTSIAGEYSKLTQQKQQLDADMVRYEIDFDAAQKKRLEDARTKLTDAIKMLSEKK